ncbi:Dipeptidyl peptidase 3 [Aduncisulcus paluster]|uniref:Dipeptidyl peptidase 3 n=1 Tax=Aduncisulcus paluster TaxID=2918883 RepID=A0ABQ5KT39_9EUKA|nr:Dipeptidyl peptidase 3 [Aduncisulcus paluster]|eukprot:gnl/Carplike_NY0171/1427_a1941_1280.p1 GENE.gnl/Carplike_NY0171/1427_a1941_1280~~gnl/Carplike_NY0171/1427_a1941_1280.p1  ORF type:complete len:716 (-),score=169.40 gnl/Carplike_NY0171/1427_a1941_1280:228-2375(-)
MDDIPEEFLCSQSFPIGCLDVSDLFEKLPGPLQQYAISLSRAVWSSFPITLYQVSKESPIIFKFIQKIFSEPNRNILEKILTSDELTQLKEYAAMFLTQAGCYLGFGDKKFLPRLPKSRLESMCKELDSKVDGSSIFDTFHTCIESIYSLEDTEKLLGMPNKNSTTYFEGLTDDECERVNQAMKDLKIPFENTIIKAEMDKDEPVIVIHFASIDIEEPVDTKAVITCSDGSTKRLLTKKGIFSDVLKTVVVHLEEAKRQAPGELQSKMLEYLINHYKHGALKDHIDYSAEWVRDKKPIVETYQGFIETYRDPTGLRAEMEGFVALVNVERTETYTSLVSKADIILPLLPWDSLFECKSFTAPAYTALEVLSFSTTGLPLAINLPNFDVVTRSIGSKNMTLQNVLSQRMCADEHPTFVPEEDRLEYLRIITPCEEVMTSLHELYGHGSGRCIKKDVEAESEGTFTDFPKDAAFPTEAISGIHKLLGLDLPMSLPKTLAEARRYQDGETYNGVFGSIASSIEECRAESVSLYLCSCWEVLHVFGIKEEEFDSFVRICWLGMLRGCVAGLEFYSPESECWLQAHCRARFAILKTVLAAKIDGKPIITLDENANVHLPDTEVLLKIPRDFISALVSNLTMSKATGETSLCAFEKLTEVDGDWLAIREAVVRQKKPRMVFSQCILPSIGDERLIPAKKDLDGVIDGVMVNVTRATGILKI